MWCSILEKTQTFKELVACRSRGWMIWVAGMGKPCKQELNANTQSIQQKSGQIQKISTFWKHMLASSRRRDTSLLNQVVHACEWETVRVRTRELCATMFRQLDVFCNSPATQQDMLLSGHKWWLHTIDWPRLEHLRSLQHGSVSVKRPGH